MKYYSIILLLFLLIIKSNANSINYYISSKSFTNDQLCGVTIDKACPSVLSALNVVPSSGNKNATFILDDGIYSGINNTNLNIFGYNIIINSLNNDSSKVTFDASAQDSDKIFLVSDDGQSPQPVFTQLSINGVSFTSTYNGILNTNILNSTFILEVNNCVFNNNSASISVFYIENDQDNEYDVNVTISNSVFNSNSFVMHLAEGCNLLIDSCSFVNSTAKKYQDASVLFMSGGGGCEISNTNITGSSISTPLNLQGLYRRNSPTLITNCYFDSNSVISNGGALALSFVYIIIENSTFNNNMGTIGGSIYAHGVSTLVYISNCKFTNNKSYGQGGSIAFLNSVVSEITNCEFIGNTGSSGGSISLEYTDDIGISNCLFDNNNSSNRGGAIYSLFSSINFNQTTIQDNSALKGGSIYCGSSTIQMPNNTQFSNNYDSGNGTDSYEYNHGVPIPPNSFNIYCALDPENTYCEIISSDKTYSSLCGYVDPDDKDEGLTKGELAGIIIGATIGGCILAFAAAWFISKTTIGEQYGSLVKNRSDSHDHDESVN